MMRPSVLKNKVWQTKAMFKPGSCPFEGEDIFILEDVRSAVKWLKRKIRSKGRSGLLQLIDKAFEDALKGGE